jgi:predicted DNA-binding transcriptional regulator AlpA
MGELTRQRRCALAARFGIYWGLGKAMQEISEVSIDRIRSRAEFAERLHISTRTLDRMDKRGQLPPRVKISDRLIGYRESDIAAFINSRVMR